MSQENSIKFHSVFTIFIGASLLVSTFGFIYWTVEKNYHEANTYLDFVILYSVLFGFYLLYWASQIRLKSHLEYIKLLEEARIHSKSINEKLEEKANLQSQYIKELEWNFSVLSSIAEKSEIQLQKINENFESIKGNKKTPKKPDGFKTIN
jgi:hypothetical protein